MIVDGATMGLFAIAPTPSWNDSVEKSVSLHMELCSRTIQLRAAEAQGGLHLDWISHPTDTVEDITQTTFFPDRSIHNILLAFLNNLFSTQTTKSSNSHRI